MRELRERDGHLPAGDLLSPPCRSPKKMFRNHYFSFLFAMKHHYKYADGGVLYMHAYSLWNPYKSSFSSFYH